MQTDTLWLSDFPCVQPFVVGGDPVRNTPLLDVNIWPADALTSYVTYA